MISKLLSRTSSNRRFHRIWSAAILALTLTAFTFAAVKIVRVGLQADGSIIVPSGQRLTPAGSHIEVADRPLGMALSPDGALMVVVTGSNFASRRLHVIDVDSASVVQTINIGDSFVGVAFSSDGQNLYVGGGRDNDVKFFRKDSATTFAADGAVSISTSEPSGLSLSPDDSTLYVALNRRHSVAIIDTASRAVQEVPVGSYPYTTASLGSKVYVSNWGGRQPLPGDETDGVIPVVVDPETGIANNGTISVLDAASRKVIANIEVGLHPSALLLSPDGTRLYVTNANSDSVSVVSTSTDQVEQTIDVRLFAGAPLGSAPNALAISPDGSTLYVANGANNAVALVNLADSKAPVMGFIPTGWFPAALGLSLDGQRLFVGDSYGFGSIAPVPEGQGRSYADRVGVVSVIDLPDSTQLASYTEEVLRNNRAPGTEGVAGWERKRRAIPMNRADGSPIRHVFYIIKENRTYDQVLGDLPQGEGDPLLVQFGRETTPNHHALAERYVLLDNFYGVGDQSALGHQWCDEAYANDYVHKYGNARNDFAGTNPMAYAPSGFLWDHARRFGKTVRNYGEFGLVTVTPSTATWTELYDDWRKGTGRIQISARSRVAGLRDILPPAYPGYELRITDQVRADVFLRELSQFEQNGDLPNLIFMVLSSDHTQGTSPGFPTPRAMVADNDLALGRIVDAISHSRFWPETAIFVTEDDAQNGLDHIDGHRTVGLLISPYSVRGEVDHTLYNQINMVRTMEQILGLPPMNQFDLAADPMFSAFTDEPDFAPYDALPNQIPLDEMNPGLAGLTGLQRELAKASMEMDFSEPDAAPEELLNRVIWHSLKGYDVPYPAR